MSLAPGARLGAYEVLRLIGAGGMGEVYQARDTRLDRLVAIKVLPEKIAADHGRRQRFEREARAVASLNHPHICDLHDVGEQDHVDFLVMEYLEGQTLANRLVRGALPAADVLRYAIELADALDHAHRQGLVHRDLKPGNVMLTKNGAKLLDFGLSKLQSSSDLPALSTIASGAAPLTAQGAVLGTYPYMAPEQLEGRETDARSDIFSFGAIVYEMTTGRRAFQGASAASLIGAILHTDPPPVSTLQPLTPPGLDRIVSRCLAKNPDDRWQTARDLLLELKWIAEQKSEAAGVGKTASPVRTRERVAWLVAALTLLLVGLGMGMTLTQPWRARPDESSQRLSLLPPPAIRFTDLFSGGGVISPDGRFIAFVGIAEDGRKLLWLRSLDSLDPQLLPTTEGATDPFWSPDSRFIGFFAQGQLKRVAVNGGPAQAICEAIHPRGGAWSERGIIVFSANAAERWYRVPAAGGRATEMKIESPNPENYWPFFLPDGLHFVFFGRPEKPGVYVASLDSTNATLLLENHVGVAYAAPGYVLTLAGSARGAEDRTLEARPFDATERKITGEPSVVAEHVVYLSGTARAAFSVSQTGRIVYETFRSPVTQLIWFDRTGKQLATLGEPVGYRRPSLSPDEKIVAVEWPDPQMGTTDIWLLETTRGVPTRLTVAPEADWSPVWSPDGLRVLFTSPRGTPPQLYQQDSRNAGAGELVLKGYRNIQPRDWSADGKRIVFAALSPDTGWDLGVLDMQPESANPDRKGVLIQQSAFNEGDGKLSPDGHWIVYVSDESGTMEVYVAPFPGPGVRKRISNGGGTQPAWRGDGRELFYVAPDGTLMAVPVTAERGFEAGTPRALFRTRMADFHSGSRGQFAKNYAVTRDGQRFLIASIIEDPPPPSVTVLLNWPAALRR